MFSHGKWSILVYRADLAIIPRYVDTILIATERKDQLLTTAIDGSTFSDSRC